IIAVISIDDSLGKYWAGRWVCRWTMEKPCRLPRFPVGVHLIPGPIGSQRMEKAFFRKSARRDEMLQHERIAVIIRYELLQRCAELTQIIRALRLHAFCFPFRKGGKIQ